MIDFRLMNDIGLVELEEDVILSESVQPVCLPAFNNASAESLLKPSSRRAANHNQAQFEQCFLVGWGQRSIDGRWIVSLSQSLIQLIVFDAFQVLLEEFCRSS